MFDFVQKELHYPKHIKTTTIQGMVICSFIIQKDGTISHIKIIRGLHPLLDKEAVRVIKEMPKWIPGKQGGKAVPVKYTLPIRFTLPDKKL